MFRVAKSLAHLLLPRAARRHGRHLLNRVGNWWDATTGRTSVRTPPVELVDGIGGGWAIGENFVRHFRDLCGLRPEESVLDVGCGVGRMAVPLTRYLSAAGRYEGFDIMRENVRWCRRAITPRWPNFCFEHADIYNREYNPTGPVRGHEYRFPYPDGTFDFAFLTSVFTHLMPPDAAHYLAELGRVLKPGGRCLATFFLLNGESNGLVDGGKGIIRLLPAGGGCRVARADVPEECVALDEGLVRNAVRAAGLSVESVRYGTWCGREPGFEFQDVVVLRKPAA
jgi:SAM-dependent methyltransferase